jgi:PTH1 family peptidyl-tRNA hydrolase
LGTDEFARLRIGIQPEHQLTDTKRFVLDEFSRTERESLPEILERAAEALRSVLRDGIRKAMSLHN